MKRKFNITGSFNHLFCYKPRSSIRKNHNTEGFGRVLENDYIVLSLGFQEISTASFADGITFFNALTLKAFGFAKAADKDEQQELLTDFRENNPEGDLDELFEVRSFQRARVIEFGILRTIFLTWF